MKIRKIITYTMNTVYSRNNVTHPLKSLETKYRKTSKKPQKNLKETKLTKYMK
jgi:hypothetical protein